MRARVEVPGGRAIEIDDGLLDARRARLASSEPVAATRLAYAAAHVVMRELGAEKDKLTRALPWIALVEQGKVFLVRGEWNVPFIQEAAAFPDSKNDDMVDAVSGVYSMLNSGVTIFVA